RPARALARAARGCPRVAGTPPARARGTGAGRPRRRRAPHPTRAPVELSSVAKMNKTSNWLADRLPVRRDVAAKLETVERERFAEPEGVMKVIAAYPEIARDLAIARREAPRGPLTRRLERIYLELHRAIFRSPTRWRQDLAALFVSD